MVVDIALKTLAFPKSLAEYEMVKDLVGNISWYFQSHCIFRLHYTVWSLSGQIVLFHVCILSYFYAKPNCRWSWRV